MLWEIAGTDAEVPSKLFNAFKIIYYSPYSIFEFHNIEIHRPVRVSGFRDSDLHTFYSERRLPMYERVTRRVPETGDSALTAREYRAKGREKRRGSHSVTSLNLFTTLLIPSLSFGTLKLIRSPTLQVVSFRCVTVCIR